MKVTTTDLQGVLLLEPQRFGDERGVFCETFRAAALAEAGFETAFIQDNCARSGPRGVVRGLHMQRAPHAQAKLVRCSRGAVLDVAVDVRPGSPTFGRAVSAVLSAQNWLQILVPTGFAHGYCTLEEDCEVLYKVTAPYAPSQEEGLLWHDGNLGIVWPVAQGEATVNERDDSWPTLIEWAARQGLDRQGRRL